MDVFTHSEAQEGWDYSDEELSELLSGEWVPADDFERACYDFIWEASVDPASVSDKTYEALKINLTPEQIIELAAIDPAGYPQHARAEDEICSILQ